jgi:hypothetical protein
MEKGKSGFENYNDKPEEILEKKFFRQDYFLEYFSGSGIQKELIFLYKRNQKKC